MAERSKSKTLTCELVSPKGDHEIYRLLDELINTHRDDLANCRIAIFWRVGWHEDADGNRTFCVARLRNDGERQLAKWDVRIEVNREVWEAADNLSNGGDLKRAMLLHGLCQVAQKFDADGEPKETENGMPVWRRRREDIREFTDVVALYGSYHAKLQHFVNAAMDAKSEPLFEGVEAEEPTSDAEAKAPKRGRGRPPKAAKLSKLAEA